MTGKSEKKNKLSILRQKQLKQALKKKGFTIEDSWRDKRKNGFRHKIYVSKKTNSQKCKKTNLYADCNAPMARYVKNIQKLIQHHFREFNIVETQQYGSFDTYQGKTRRVGFAWTIKY